MACTDLFLVIKGRNNTAVFGEGMGGPNKCLGSSASPPPACPAQGPKDLAARLLLHASLWLYIPAKEASHAVWGALSCCSISARGGLLHPVPATCRGPGVFYCVLRMLKHFWRRCSRSLPAHFEKYPASVEHLSVKGEEIPPRYYFLPIVLAWCGFGYYGFVK